jgi:hypothetical protein
MMASLPSPFEWQPAARVVAIPESGGFHRTDGPMGCTTSSEMALRGVAVEDKRFTGRYAHTPKNYQPKRRGSVSAEVRARRAAALVVPRRPLTTPLARLARRRTRAASST